VLSAWNELDRLFDLVVIEGAGHSGVGSVIGLNNASTAKMLDAPVCLVTEGGIGSVIDAVHLNRALFTLAQADVRLIMVNKLQARKRQDALQLLSSALEPCGMSITGGLNYSPILANPTLSHISQLLGLPLYGDHDARTRIIHDIQLGAASSQKVVDGLESSTLLIITSSRDELIVTISSLYNLPEYKEKLVGLVIAGFVPMSKISQQILDDSNIPYIRVQKTTADVFSTIREDVAKISAEDQEKIAWIREKAGQEIDFSVVDAFL
jgi:BioD-like phosphotransacetylase family protein